MHWSHFSPIKFSLHLQVPVDWSQDIPRDPIRLQPQATIYVRYFLFGHYWITPAGMIYQGPITYVSILGNYRNLESIHHTVVLRILVYIYTKFVLKNYLNYHVAHNL